MTKKISKIQHGVDIPLENPKDDCLGRANFSKRIFDVIKNAPIESNIRIGLFGEWGTGKTSAINFIKWYCHQSKQPVASINPWQFKSREDAWSGFVYAIDKGIANWQGKRVAQFERKAKLKKVSKILRDLSAPFITPIGQAFSTVLGSSLEGMLDPTKEKVQALLDKALGSKRLFIFIDDLDRADFDVAYDFLIFLNEFCNFNKCVYVIGLDRRMAAQIIQNKTQVNEIKAKEFLGKIINWSFDLPAPSQYEWNKLLEKELVTLDKGIDAKVLYSIVKHLPKNPRKFKHYLRYLSSLHKAFLGRFDSDDLDLQILYLGQLLRLEFPDAFDKLNKNNAVIHDLCNSMMRDFIYEEKRKKERGKEIEKPDWEKNIDKIFLNEDEEKHRFMELYTPLRNACHLKSYNQVRNYLLVVEDPEPLTWKEYRQLKQELHSLNKSRIKARLSKFIVDSIRLRGIETVREFIKMLLRERNYLLEKMSDSELERDQMKIVKDVLSVMDIFQSTIEIDDLFQEDNPIFDNETFKECYGQLKFWAHFKDTVLTKVREKEKVILLILIKKLCQIRGYRIQIYSDIVGTHTSQIEPDKSFAPMRSKLINIAGEYVTKEVIDRFSEEGGIAKLRSNDNYWTKDIVLLSTSLLYSADTIKKLATISKRAKTSSVVQRNFLEYVEWIFSEAIQRQVSVEGEAAKIINHVHFLDIFWKSALALPLNRRFVGSLEQLRQGVLSSLFNNDEKSLPVPIWYMEKVRSINNQNKGLAVGDAVGL